MPTKHSESLRSRALRWFESNPWIEEEESSQDYNLRMYKVFKCDLPEDNIFSPKTIDRRKNRQGNLIVYKHQYYRELQKRDEEKQEKEKQKLKKKIQDSLKRGTDSKQNEQTTTIEGPILPTRDPGFENFMRWFSVPEYGGLFEWQKEYHRTTWKSKYTILLGPRDHGKSIVLNGEYQWAMWYQEMDVLLLGWTDRRKQVAQYVYNFFAFYDLIEPDKRNSPFHFRTKNGSRFDCYLITSKETLGMHSEGETTRFSNMTEDEWEEYKTLFKVDLEEESERSLTEDDLKNYIEDRKSTNRRLWISVDDPIDISFMKERHKEESLELHFNSSLYGIHPYKWSFTGTRKFEGDFFDFIDHKFGSEMTKYVRKTVNDGKLLAPERFTHPDLVESTYERDLKDGKMCLEQIRKHVGEYAWFSEYEQDPHPITGEVWDHVSTVNTLDTPVNRKHDICFATIDRATTTNKNSAFTGCVIGVREISSGDRIITHDFTDKIEFIDLLIMLNDFFIEFRAKHEQMILVMIVEKQGGGDDFISLAKNLREFIRNDGSRVKNMLPELVIIEDVHNTGNKLDRIRDRLGAPIKNEKIKFMSYLLRSELVTEILNFPHSSKLDAIDSLANADFILLERYQTIISPATVKDMINLYKLANHESTIKQHDSSLAEEELMLRNKLKENMELRRNIF